MDRRAFLGLGILAAACGDDMTRTGFPRSGTLHPSGTGFTQQPATGPGYRGKPGGAVVDPSDLTALPNASALKVDWDTTQGITPSATLIGSTGAPAVTITGGPSDWTGQGLFVQVNQADTSKFDWNLYDGGGLARGIGELGVTRPSPSGNYSLPGTSIVLSFPSGTYTTAHFWRVACQSWAARFGGSSMLLDNSSVYAAKGPIIQGPYSWSDNKPSLLFDQDFGAIGLGNNTGVPALLSGNNVPWHIAARVQPTNSHSGSPFTCWSFSHNTTTTGNFTDFGWLVSPAEFRVRRNDTGTAVSVVQASDLPFGPLTVDVSFDGSLFEGRLNGIQLFASTSGGNKNITLQRFLLGVIKLGTAAVANQGWMRLRRICIYNAKQPESASGMWAVRKALMQ